jgi:hypothetical protein
MRAITTGAPEQQPSVLTGAKYPASAHAGYPTIEKFVLAFTEREDAMTITVRRGPKSERFSSGDGWDASLSNSPTSIVIKCLVSASGGDSRITTRIHSDEYHKLALLMLETNPSLAIDAFAEALKAHALKIRPPMVDPE